MRTPSAKIDAEIATLAAVARSEWEAKAINTTGRAKAIATRGAFARLTGSIPRVATHARRRSFVIEECAEGWDQSQRERRLKTLRVELEEVLLALDECCSPGAERPLWPSEEDLGTLVDRVNSAAGLLRKRLPVVLWGRCKRFDRHFPKLDLCGRIERLIGRIVVCLPSKPIGAIPKSAGISINQLKRFLEAVGRCRNGECDPGAVDWREFTPVLLHFQNAAPQRMGSMPTQKLGRPRRAARSTEALEAYVAFLELDREDLLWSRRHSEFLPVLQWTGRPGNLALVHKLEPYWPGSSSFGAMKAEQLHHADFPPNVRWPPGVKRAAGRNWLTKRDGVRGPFSVERAAIGPTCAQKRDAGGVSRRLVTTWVKQRRIPSILLSPRVESFTYRRS